MKNILVLGAGLVTKPLIEYLSGLPNFNVTLGDVDLKKSAPMVANRANAKAIQISADDQPALITEISKADLVISLLPYTFHVRIAKLCLQARKTMITASYVSPEMQALDAEAKQRGILLLNEIGLDPGIDHMSAMRIIHNVHNRGGKILSFKSYCGGLPSPHADTNPWHYKFSWSPHGVLMAGKNTAKFLQNNETMEIPGDTLFEHHWPMQIAEFNLEAYPNRNALPYAKLYGIEDAATIFRGTLRFPGWCNTMNIVSKSGMLEKTPELETIGKSLNEIFNQIIQNKSGQDAEKYLSDKFNLPSTSETIKKFKWLGLFEDVVMETQHNTPLDFLAAVMRAKMSFSKNEKDLIVLYHEFEAAFSDKTEKITSTLINYGQSKGDSAMARNVSLPAAIAARLILENKISLTGVHIPVLPEIYNAVLDELAESGISCEENFVEI